MCICNPGISLRVSDDINPNRLHLQIHCIYAVKCTVTQTHVKAHLYFCEYKSNCLESLEGTKANALFAFEYSPHQIRKRSR